MKTLTQTSFKQSELSVLPGHSLKRPKPRTRGMTRHFHDFEKLMHTSLTGFPSFSSSYKHSLASVGTPVPFCFLGPVNDENKFYSEIFIKTDSLF